MRTHKFSTPQQQHTVGARIQTTTKWEVKKGFSTSYNPKVSKFDLYCVIDQEQQSTGQVRAALSRGLKHAVVQKIPNPTPNHRGDEGQSPRGHVTQEVEKIDALGLLVL